MKRVLATVLVVILAMSLMACGENKESITAEIFVSSFKEAGFPISDVEIYDENTDPNAVLGRPGEYIGKFNFTHEPKPETYQYLTIEIFEKSADAKKREAYIVEINEAMGFMGEYTYLDSIYLLRIPFDLTTEEAELYNKAFNQIINGEQVDDASAAFAKIQQEINANKSLKDYEFEFDDSQNKDDIIEILGKEYEEYAYSDDLYLVWSDDNGVLEVAFYEEKYMYSFWYTENEWKQQEENHIEMIELYNDASDDEPQETNEEPEPSPEPTQEPTEKPFNGEEFKLTHNNGTVDFKELMDASLKDVGLDELQTPFMNNDGGYTYKINENLLYAFKLDENEDIIEAQYLNLASYDASFPDAIAGEEMAYMIFLYAFMIEDAEGNEDFFKSIKLRSSDGDDLMLKTAASYGGYDIEFCDTAVGQRYLKITPSVE